MITLAISVCAAKFLVPPATSGALVDQAQFRGTYAEICDDRTYGTEIGTVLRSQSGTPRFSERIREKGADDEDARIWPAAHVKPDLAYSLYV